MASSDFLENAISSKIDEKSLNDLTNSLESSLPNSQSVTNSIHSDGGQRLVVRSVNSSTGPLLPTQPVSLPTQPVSLPTQPQPQRLGVASQPQQVIRAAGTMVMSGGQRLVGPNGQVIVAAPGQQLVRTSGGQLVLQQQAAASPVRPPVSVGGAGVQRVVIPHPGQPGSQISVPLATLQSLQAGQGIPTGTPGHLLVKTETGQYQILRVGPPGAGTGASQAVSQQQPAPRPAQPAPQVRLPTQPVARATVPNSTPVVTNSTPAAPAASSVNSAAAAGSMGQQMTPDTAKIKCKNFLATLLRLASDQPESVARNVRTLIQGLIDGRVEPEVFTTRLQRELNSSPQPCLVPFLKKSLPYLQHSLATRELTIEGVNAPSLSQVGKLPPAAVTTASLPTTPTATAVRPAAGNTFVRPAPVAAQPRPTFIRPALPTRPVQISTGTRSLMPPPASVMKLAAPVPAVPAAVVRDKKSGGAYSAAGDDDINDVAAMGGVNLAEEANSILGATDNVGSIIRSCKDESFLQTGLLHQRAARICREKGLESPSQEVLNLISHATQERLKSLVSKLSVIAEHRLDIIKTEGPYVVTQDVKQQLRFLEDLDKIEKKKHDEEEKELLFKAAKSRAKSDDPEKEKLKAKAKEMQSIEAERIRHEDANRTALEAIGNHKKRKIGDLDTKLTPNSGISLRSRPKRVHVRDLLFLMEQEKCLKHSNILFRSYCS